MSKTPHEVKFVSYPKLMFIWPLIVAGYVFYFLGPPVRPTAEELQQARVQAAVEERLAQEAPAATQEVTAPPAGPRPFVVDPYYSERLAWLGWIYIALAVVVIMTLGVDVDRNHAIFWIVLVGGLYALGLWLRDVQGFTFFGDLYRWLVDLGVQYDRAAGLALSLVLTVPFVLMLLYAQLNDKWRITHNEFEHHSFGRMDDSLGRGAKSIRTEFPDVLELLLGLAGTLIVYNATGTKELRRIEHVMFLPFVRNRLDKILERTAVTAAQTEEEEEEG